MPFVATALANGYFQRAAALIFVAGITDALDGWLARHFRWTSQIGAYLDPLADKLLLVSTYVALGVQGAVPAWLVGLVLGRDLVILAMVGIAFRFTNVRSFPPSTLGKLSTAIQVFTALAIIVDHGFVTLEYKRFELFALGLTATGTGLSGLHYLYRGLTEFPAARRAHKAAKRQ